MTYRISGHAREEMARRNIPEAFVAAVLAAPEEVLPAQHGKRIYQALLRTDDGRDFLVRVIVAEDTDPPTVVTVYRTGRLAKYGRQI